MESHEISKFDTSKVYTIAKFMTPNPPPLTPSAVLRAPTAKAKQKPKPFLKPKQRKKWLEEQKEAMKDDTHSSTQWKIEDPKIQKAFTGTPEPRRDRAQYVLLINKGQKWSFAPVELYQFRPEVTYQTLSLEEAEVKMKAKTADSRWMMRKGKTSMQSRLLDRLQGDAPIGGGAEATPTTAPSTADDLLQGDDEDRGEERGDETLPAIEGESKEERLKRLKKKKKREDQDIDYTETFDDDEDGQVTKARSEDEEEPDDEENPGGQSKESKEYKRLKELTDKELPPSDKEDDSDSDELSDLSDPDLSDDSELSEDEEGNKKAPPGGAPTPGAPGAPPTKPKGKQKRSRDAGTPEKPRKKARKGSATKEGGGGEDTKSSSSKEKRSSVDKRDKKVRSSKEAKSSSSSGGGMSGSGGGSITEDDVRRELQQSQKMTTSQLLERLQHKFQNADRDFIKTFILPILKKICTLETDKATQTKFLALKA